MRSNLTVTVAAASRMLCARSDVKTELGIASATTTYDSKIDRLIVGASLKIAELLGREPWLQTYVEKMPGQGGRYLRLSRWPLKGDPASVTLGTGSSPSTITASTYSVAGPWRDRLYSATSWNLSSVDAPKHLLASGDRPLDYNVTYAAGWVMPDEITAWPTSGTAVTLGKWYKSADVDEPFIFIVTTAGTTSGTEPTLPTVEETTVTDGTAVFTSHAQRLPEDLEEAAMMLVVDWFRGAVARPSGIVSESFEGMRIEYGRESAAVSSAVMAIVGSYA